VKRILFEAGFKPHEIYDVRLKDILLYKQVHERKQWRDTQLVIGLRNDVRGIVGADPIDPTGPKNGRDEEAIEELEERWSDWIDEQTDDTQE